MTDLTDPITPADAAITYGPNGIRCGCGRDAHSNLSPCHADLAAWITENIGGLVLDLDEARDQILAAWELTWPTEGVRPLRTHLGWTLACAATFGPYPTAEEAAAAVVTAFAPIGRRSAE